MPRVVFLLSFFSAIPSSRKSHQKSGFGEILLIKCRSRVNGIRRQLSSLLALIKWTAWWRRQKLCRLVNARNIFSSVEEIHRKFMSDHVNHRQHLEIKLEVSRLSWIESFFSAVFPSPIGIFFSLCLKLFVLQQTMNFFAFCFSFEFIFISFIHKWRFFKGKWKNCFDFWIFLW